MNIAIIGSRTFNNYTLLKAKMAEVLNGRDMSNMTIVSGGAQGADALGKRFAKEHGFGYVEHEAKWKDLTHPDARIKTGQYGEYDANAGHRRNTLIIKDADVIVAFHNGSPGTANSLKKAKVLKKEIHEFKF